MDENVPLQVEASLPTDAIASFVSTPNGMTYPPTPVKGQVGGVESRGEETGSERPLEPKATVVTVGWAMGMTVGWAGVTVGWV